ncbi:hypothetical protein AC578_2023 [Lecanosticta acicola]|uniref:Actin cortical patch SUR7/pH-response regulator PalI n=1 Tax=Lecanosticta acicola TaxID=111012 RepID=A0AAI8YYS2_9PEZI|nr:hypothetical protein AC578_2023 [Lecanosticta acicola]
MGFKNSATSGRMQPYAVLPVLVMTTAFVLSFLCVFAGNKPGYMEDYAFFTLNVSRVGENLIQDFDDKIYAINLNNLINPSEPKNVPTATATTAPTAMITRAPRDLSNLVGDLSSDLGGAESAVQSKVSVVNSAAGSEASALESAAASKINSAVEALETKIVHAVNKAYTNLIEDMDLKDFYSIHMMTTCSGEYQFKNGSNITHSVGPAPPRNSTHQHVDTCEKHSALDPVSVVRILYEIGIVLVAISFVLSIWGMIRFSRKAAVINALATFPAAMLVGLASAAVTGVAVGAEKLVNFAGKGIGISGAAGNKFISLTWAVTALLLVNIGIWCVLAFVGDKTKVPRRDGSREKEVPYGTHYELRGSADKPRGANSWYIREPEPVHPESRHGFI